MSAVCSSVELCALVARHSVLTSSPVSGQRQCKVALCLCVCVCAPVSDLMSSRKRDAAPLQWLHPHTDCAQCTQWKRLTDRAPKRFSHSYVHPFICCTGSVCEAMKPSALSSSIKACAARFSFDLLVCVVFSKASFAQLMEEEEEKGRRGCHCVCVCLCSFQGNISVFGVCME